jgi:hypothetical protein
MATKSKKTKVLTKGMHLSAMQLVVYALIFGLIGGIISWAAFAAPQSAGQCTLTKDSAANTLSVRASGLAANTYYDAQIYSYDTAGARIGSSGNGANTTDSTGSFSAKYSIADLTPYANTGSYKYSVYALKGHKIDFTHELAACTASI